MAYHVRILSKEEADKNDAEVKEQLGFRRMTETEISQMCKEAEETLRKTTLWVRLLSVLGIGGIGLAIYFWNANMPIACFLTSAMLFFLALTLLFVGMVRDDAGELLRAHRLRQR